MMTKFDLQAEIKKKGLTIEQAADKLGVSRKTFYTYMDKFEAMELSPKLFESLAMNLELSNEFLVKYLSERHLAGYSNANYIFDFLQVPGGGGINSKYFKGIKYDDIDIVNLLSKGLSASTKYIVLSIDSEMMAPAINSGDLVVCEEVDAKYMTRPYDYFIYFLNTESGYYLARVVKSDAQIWLLQIDNSRTPIYLDAAELINLYLVKRIYQQRNAAPKIFKTQNVE